MREALKEGGVSAQLHVVRDGEQALAFLRREQPFEASPRPQLVLLDLNLPRKSGPEVLSEIRRDRALRDIPVVILSNSSRPEDVARAFDLHADGYITKPSDIKSLIEIGKAVENLVRNQEVSSRPRPRPPAPAVRPQARSAFQRSA